MRLYYCFYLLKDQFFAPSWFVDMEAMLQINVSRDEDLLFCVEGFTHSFFLSFSLSLSLSLKCKHLFLFLKSIISFYSFNFLSIFLSLFLSLKFKQLFLFSILLFLSFPSTLFLSFSPIFSLVHFVYLYLAEKENLFPFICSSFASQWITLSLVSTHLVSLYVTIYNYALSIRHSPFFPNVCLC